MRRRGARDVKMDESAIREAVILLLESEGCEIEAYESALTFLKTIDPANLGCIVTDIRIPVMSGID